MTINQETKPIWISKEGRKFYSPKDFDDSHLSNMIPFLARGIKALDQIKERLGDDGRVLIQRSIDHRLNLTETLLEEIRLRGLEEPLKASTTENWEQDYYKSLSYYTRPWE